MSPPGRCGTDGAERARRVPRRRAGAPRWPVPAATRGCAVSGGVGAGAGVVSLHVDWTRCRGRGLCTELFAERLERDEWGYPIARAGTPGARAGGDPGDPGDPGTPDPGTPDTGTRDVPVRPHERAAAADAVAMCPLQALRLVER
ncbi:ferredoxin [Curtobacterium sp. MCLR17_059]|uniref:ferredoxin n=1 Tax=Curtobacterium sp. MCLR17_059 TaxID=2175636 RepID=UPI0021AC926A|nr:ferredoxin [Curtobacterium sp. MCLR17_059]